MKWSSAFFLAVILISTGCQEPKTEIQSYVNKAITQKQINDEMDRKIKMLESLSKGSTAPIGILLSQDSAIITTDIYTGKLLIINFWATWCGPCVDQMPNFKAFERKYENESIEFISVSIDEEFSYWKDYIAENNEATDDYWFGRKETDPFFTFMFSQMQINGESMIVIGLPKYVIISPDGKIINLKAPKPVDPMFEIEIERLIQKYSI